MIRHSTTNVLYRREGRLVALMARGQHCAEHECGVGLFARTMGFVLKEGAKVAPLGKPVAANRMLFRKASIVHPVPGSDVLTLGTFAKASVRTQERTIRESPADFDDFVGSFGGRWTNTTPLAMEEPFLDLMENSDLNLGVAYDHKAFLVGGTSDRSKAIVAWLAGLFASGEACLMTGYRFVVLCDPTAADDLSKVGFGEDAMPAGYEREVLRSDTERLALAA